MRASSIQSGPRFFRWLILLIAVVFAACLLSNGCHAADLVTSWYGEDHRGRPMANGRPFNPDRPTCASWFHPLGTRLEVRHARRRVVVTVTDRGPARRLLRTLQLDLSRAAFAALGNTDLGLLAVTVTPISAGGAR